MSKLKQLNLPLYVGLFLVLVLVFVSIGGHKIAPYTLEDKLESEYKMIDGEGVLLAPPMRPFETTEYLLGTDNFGYDLLTKLLYGAKYTIGIAFAVSILKIIIGGVIGLYAGTSRKPFTWWSAVENSWSYVPIFLILYFFLRPISFQTSLEPSQHVTVFIGLTTLLSLPSIVASVRKQTKTISEMEFIKVARTLGANRNRIVWKHIFPQLKEGLLVMFVMEIVYVMTVMGQLGIFHLFIGGTEVQRDPTIYLSITNEWAGLIGQSRGYIWHDQHILLIPLFALIFATSSFVLLAKGLQNYFQTDYQRAPWIPTGQKQSYPLPKKKIKISNRLELQPLEVIFGMYLILFVAGMFVIFVG
ncbi:ABC transporter permease subunit [Bacillus tianshenii]|nr:ABC transporter permease subunit [Bacillus tianshenii]